ncbi:MAG: InlB B-repeat-containing protein [Clostridia bacterium]|nr:InlB B-repeat-containing protein [Clostridia bacterium]
MSKTVKTLLLILVVLAILVSIIKCSMNTGMSGGTTSGGTTSGGTTSGGTTSGGTTSGGTTSGGANSSGNNGGSSGVASIFYHTVIFHTNGGTAVSTMKTNNIKSAPKTEKEGYYFDGWFYDQGLSLPAVFPLKVDKDVELYAKWLKLEDERSLSNTSIKFMADNYSPSATYYITPTGFDFDRMNELNLGMKIIVTYEVYYRKDYEALWDIGYMGAPKYEVSLVKSDGLGQFKSDLTTTTSSVKRTISAVISAADLKDQRITLTFSTDNIQNVIYFKNITVEYSCGRMS